MKRPAAQTVQNFPPPGRDGIYIKSAGDFGRRVAGADKRFRLKLETISLGRKALKNPPEPRRRAARSSLRFRPGA